MKLRVFCTVLLTGLVLVGCSVVGPTWVFPFNSARIEYSLSGDIQGKEVLFIDGEKEARESVVVTEVLGEKIVTQSAIITNGENVFLENSVSGTDLKENVHHQKLQELSGEERKEYYLNNVVLGGLEPEKIGVETVAGKECNLYKVNFGSICVWENVVLKKEIDLMENQMTMVAEKIELDVVIPRNTFEFEVL